MSDSSSPQKLQSVRQFSDEEQKKVSEWSARIRKKHSVPNNYSHMIDRARIDEYIKWAETSEFIFVYDDLRTLCKCSYGKIAYDLTNPYGTPGDASRQRVDAWKVEMRERYHVPAEYEIVMNYGENNNVDRWMAFCECRNAVSAKDNIHGGIFWFFNDGHNEYMPTEYEYNYSVSSDYKVSETGVDMTQLESDCIAHFLQIGNVIQNSTWNHHKLLYQANMNGDGKVRADMPSLEQTVFALLYMRQLIGNRGNDDLLNNACQYYIQHSVDRAKSIYVGHEQKGWNDLLQQKPMHIDLAKIVPSNQMLLEAFQYGSLIIHSPDRVRSSDARTLFEKIYLDENIRINAIFELNSIMKTLFSNASNIAVLIQNDFANWIYDKKVLAPDVMWQHNMFQWNPTVEKKEPPKDQPPVFGVAYNVEISEVKQ